ncbi:MAG: hypothetical protein C4526_08785 [Nitrospiraceae bacterium]|nr:MAG: hypothetical protein C4526_08785 [Nitrospiraceae bacterium]
MEFECDACEKKIEYDPILKKRAMPDRWRMHKIKNREFLLCEGCGNPAAFYGGLAPLLKQRLHQRHGIEFNEND